MQYDVVVVVADYQRVPRRETTARTRGLRFHYYEIHLEYTIFESVQSVVTSIQLGTAFGCVQKFDYRFCQNHNARCTIEFRALLLFISLFACMNKIHMYAKFNV